MDCINKLTRSRFISYTSPPFKLLREASRRSRAENANSHKDTANVTLDPRDSKRDVHETVGGLRTTCGSVWFQTATLRPTITTTTTSKTLSQPRFALSLSSPSPSRHPSFALRQQNVSIPPLAACFLPRRERMYMWTHTHIHRQYIQLRTNRHAKGKGDYIADL